MPPNEPLQDPYEQPEFSVVEELDSPEPTAKEGWFNPGREALLGILLLASILLWAGWQWLDGEHKASSYQSAQQAASAKDWDSARAQFKDASGYKDADKRAADADKRVADRNSHYALAVEHAARKDGIATLLEVGEVEKIQPHYSDTLQLKEQAVSEAYAEALTGVIAMRPNAQPPGLYYRLNGRWLWLEGSDAQSQVRSSSDSIEGRVVYDAPDVVGTDQSSGGGRRIMLAVLPTEGSAASPSVSQLSFKLEDYDMFNCQSDGVWAFKCCWSGNSSTAPVGNALNYYQAIAFQANDQSTVLPMRLPGTDENRLVLDIDYTHHQLLSANWSYEVGAGSGVSPIVNVFQASTSPSFISMGMGMGPGGPGTNLHLLYTHHGTLSKAQFSSDGTYALLTAVSFPNDQDRSQDIGTVSLIVLDLQGLSPPRVLAQQNRVPKVSEVGTYLLSNFRSAIVSRGPYSGRVVVAREGEGEGGSTTSILEIIDPTDHVTPPLQVKLQNKDLQSRVIWTGVQSSSGLLLSAQSDFPQTSPGAPVSTTAALIDFTGGKGPVMATVAADSRVQVAPVTVRGDNFLYRFSYNDTNVTNKLEIYKLPLGSLRPLQEIAASETVTQTQHQLVYSGPYLRTDALPSLNGSTFFYTFNYSPGAMAYSDGRDLFVSTYDGTAAVKLESGVTTLYPGTDPADDYVNLR